MKKATPVIPTEKPASIVRFDRGQDVRAIARERVGPVKPAQIIKDKKLRKKPKHKLPPAAEAEAE
jgi:hypothetical protein